ncbi:SHOCT domain-containing protein [Halogeometricum limi]|uniref:Short C-terminal domain-containing protein n=1 Tax=Halogeometricum limi TaxID=555875 RepID=A0A1I6HVU3_9EURY|nr:SHOCT domain-containing protein [Halogeometricum limi]SFR58563.1 Short C-terminal domain-containing protein [Halogeometricum limi]
MVSLRSRPRVVAAALVLFTTGVAFLLSGGLVLGAGFCVLAVVLARAAPRDAESPEPNEVPPETSDTALATLRTRYARGELSEEQFEAKLERLVDVETLEDVEESVERRRERERASERE